MTEITKYVADDGTVFEDEDQCINYENYNLLQPYLQSMDLRLYNVDPNGNVEIIPMLRLCADLCAVIEEFNGLVAETEEALTAFLHVYDDYSYVKTDAFDEPGAYTYDSVDGEWTKVAPKAKYWNNIAAGMTLPKFKNKIAKEIYQKINGEESN